MLIKNWMTASVITIDSNDSIEKAMELLKSYNHRMLPVVEKGKLVGVMTDRDIKASSGLSCTEKEHLGYDFVQQKVKNIMKQNPICVFPEFTVDEAAELMLINKISGLPVVNKEQNFLGILTKSDVFRLWVLLTGAGKKGFKIGISASDKPSVIENILNIIKDYGGQVGSLLCTAERSRPGFRRIYIRFYHVDVATYQCLMEELTKSFDVLYIIDYYKKTREIFETDKPM